MTRKLLKMFLLLKYISPKTELEPTKPFLLTFCITTFTVQLLQYSMATLLFEKIRIGSGTTHQAIVAQV